MAETLPQELTDKIVEHSYETTRDIIPLLLVSKSWKLAAERLLYRLVPAEPDVLRTLESNSHLASLVHKLKLSCKPRLKNWESNLQVFSSILLITPNIYSVDIIGPLIQNYTNNDSELLIKTIQFLDSIQQLRWLRIRYIFRFHGLRELFMSLIGWPELEELELNYALICDVKYKSWGTKSVFCPRLRRLEIFGTKLNAKDFTDLSHLKAPIENFSVNGVENKDEEILKSLFTCISNWAESLLILRLNGMSKLERNSAEWEFPLLPNLYILRSSFTVIHPHTLRQMPKLFEMDYIVTSSTENEIAYELIEVLEDSSILPSLCKLRLLGLGHDPEQIELLTKVCMNRSIQVVGL